MALRNQSLLGFLPGAPTGAVQEQEEHVEMSGSTHPWSVSGGEAFGLKVFFLVLGNLRRISRYNYIYMSLRRFFEGALGCIRDGKKASY